MNELLLGIDIGTSSCKAAVFTPDGRVAADAAADYNVYYPHEGFAEQDPDEWWDAVCLAVRTALEKGGINPSAVKGIGIDGQSWSAIPIDEGGRVLSRTPIWMDTRADDICSELNEKAGADRIFALSGNPLKPSYTTAKILWYERNLPDIYPRIYKILQSNSFIAYRLTGVVSQDPSQGYGLHCFDMRRGVWDEEMCQALGIPYSFLPGIYPCDQVIGRVTDEAASLTGLKAGTPVVAGGVDAACGTLGAGVIRPGETQEQGGQAGGMSICTGSYTADERLILGYHVVPDLWLLQGGTTGGGGVMRWLEQQFGAYEREEGKKRDLSSLDLYNEEAAAVPAGSDGLIFLPYMSGERTPIWDPYAKGVYYGLDFGKTKGHFIRAAMEGTAFALKHNLDVAEEAGAHVDTMYAMGGSANSRLWTQIKADITGRRIAVPSSDTATTLGAAILAGVGTDLYRDYDEAVSLTVHVQRVHEPDPSAAGIYEENYETYLELYEQLKGIMKKRGEHKK